MSSKFLFYLERYSPIAGSLLSFLVLIKFNISVQEAHIPQIASAFFTIYAVLLGFISASLSIFFSIQDRKFIKTMKSSGAFKAIIKYHYCSIIWCMCAILIAFTVTISTGNEAIFNCAFVSKILISIGIGAMLSFLRVTYLLCRVLSLDSSDTPSRR